jgi:tetratricopeptide (TPR) repeat protein
VVAALAAAVLSLLVLTSIVAVAAYVRTSAASRETATKNEELKNALAAEQAQRERAEKSSASALEAMNRIYDRFAPNRIIVTPALPAENAAADGPELPPQPVLSPEAVPLLEDLLGFYEQLAREGSENPNQLSRAAEAEQRIGDIRQRLGQLVPAIAAYRKAIDLYGRTTEGRQDDALRIKVARTHNELGRTLRALQRTDEAGEAHARALATLAAAPREDATRPEYRYELARTYYFQARREPIEGPPEPPPDRGRGPDHERGRGPEGFGRGPGFGGRGGPPGPGEPPPRQRAIRILEELVKDHRAVPEYRHLLACCYRDGPPKRPSRGGPADAAPDQAVELLRQLVKEFPRVPDYRYDLCETLARVGFPGGPLPPDEVPTGRVRLEEAVALSRGLVQEYPNVPLYAAAHASVHDRLGVLLHQTKQLDDAEKTLRKAVTLQTALVRQHPEVVAYDFSLALMQASLARVLADRDNLKEAKALLEVSTDRLGTMLTRDPRLGSARLSLGRALRDFAGVLGKLGEAERAAVALRTAESLGPERGPGPFGPRDRPPP